MRVEREDLSFTWINVNIIAYIPIKFYYVGGNSERITTN